MVIHLSPDSKRHYQQLLKELATYAELETDLAIVASDGRRSSCSSLILAAASPFLVEWLLDGGDCVILPDMDGDWVEVFCYSLLQSPQASEDISGLLEITRLLEVDLGISWGIEIEGEGEEDQMLESVESNYEFRFKADDNKMDDTIVRDEILEEGINSIGII